MGKLKNLIKAQAVRLLGYQKPDPKVWVFSSTDNCHYNYNSRYLFEYVKENYKDIWLRFEYDEVKYIVVPNDAERISLIKFINDIPNENFKSDVDIGIQRSVLISKILVLDEIKEDW